MLRVDGQYPAWKGSTPQTKCMDLSPVRPCYFWALGTRLQFVETTWRFLDVGTTEQLSTERNAASGLIKADADSGFGFCYRIFRLS